MISWIQRTFAKHTKLVFLFLLIVITIPFVFTIGAAPGIGKAGNKVLERSFFNVNLGNEEQARRVFSDGRLSAQLKAGYDALEGAQAQQYALQRVAGLALADDLHLPNPSPDQVSKYITTLRAFQNEQGQFDQKAYTKYGDSIKTGDQGNTAMVNRVLRDDTRLDQLSKIVGGPGYVMPGDIKQQLIRADSSWTVQVASLDYASFNPTIDTSDAALKKYFEENAANYDVPSRARFSYVEFKNADFTPANNPTEADLRAYYLSNASAFPVPPEPEKKAGATPAPTGPTDNFPKVRAQVEAALKNAAAGRIAAKAANDFTLAVYERKLTANSAELAAFLAAQHLSPVTVAPFAPDNPPQDKPWLAAYGEQIGRLNQARFFSDALSTPTGSVVLLWSETLPEYKPLFNEARERVVADYKDSEKHRLFVARGRVLRAQLQAAASRSPADFATVAAAEKLEVKNYPPFTLRQPPAEMPPQAMGALRNLEAGQVADMMDTGQKGFFIFAQQRKLPDLDPASPRYLDAQKQLMLFAASSNENSYLGEMVETELKKSAPLDQR